MHLGAQFAEHMRSDVVGGAVGGVDHQLQPVEIQVVREGALAEFDVAALGVGHAARAAQFFRADAAQRLVHRLLDGGLDVVGQLHAMGGEELDAVVLVRIVRGADHDTGGQAQRARQVGHGRRRDGPGQQHVDTGGRQAGFQGGFQHVAGNAGVLADHDLGPVAAAPAGVLAMFARQHPAGGIAQTQREGGVDHRAADFAAHAVGTKIFALTHVGTAPCSAACHTFSASTVAATSCTRTMAAPRATHASAAATLPARRSPTGLPVAAPIMDLRETPTSRG